MSDTEHTKAFIIELEKEIKWEWHWEKLNRYFIVSFNWITWSVRFLVLVITVFLISIGKQNLLSQYWLVFVLVIFSFLNLAIPLIFAKRKFRQRQEVHDRNARKYEVTKVELLAGTICLEEAVKQFKKIRTEPTEVLVSRTP